MNSELSNKAQNINQADSWAFGLSSDSWLNQDINEKYSYESWDKEALESITDNLLGFPLSKIPTASKKAFLSFATNQENPSRYTALMDTLESLTPNLRNKLAESFLAADFGPDFGDSLLDIANSDRISGEQLAEILDTISSCRASIHDIASLYSQIDHGDFSRQYSRAANERLTDALAVFRQIAKTGTATADLDWAGQTNFDYSSAIEALKYETDSLAIIDGTVSDVILGEPDAFAERILSQRFEHNRSMYNFYSPNHGYVLLYLRPEGASTFDATTEYGKYRSTFAEQPHNAGVEASISFITNPVSPFSLPNPFRPNRHKVKNPEYYDPSTMDKVSAIRLDREGRIPGAPPDDPNRSPINPIGTISVDLAAIGDRPDTPSGKIARFLSTGNKLRQESSSTDFSLNHNTNWFNQQKYGTADGFKNLVQYLAERVDILCTVHPPTDNEHSIIQRQIPRPPHRRRQPPTRYHQQSHRPSPNQ